MEIRITDADGFDRHAQGSDIAVVLISRKDIEAMRVGSTVERLMLLSDCAKHVHRFAGRVAIQVEGYDSDARPLVLIPQCVRFFRAVNAQWNFWLHFLAPDAEQIKLIVLMLVDVKAQAINGPYIGYDLRSPWQLGTVLGRLFAAMTRLQETFEVPPAHSEVMIDAVLKTFEDRPDNEAP